MQKGRQKSFGKWKRIFLALLCICFLAAASLAGLNLLTDPFGVFGDPVMHWQAYDMTQNPQTAKFAYLKKHPDKYNAFVIGGPEAGVYSTDTLNEYTGCHFYNFSMSRGDGNALETMVSYLAGQKHTKEILLCLDPGEIWGDPENRRDQGNWVGQENQRIKSQRKGNQESQLNLINSKDSSGKNLRLCLPNTEEGVPSVIHNGRYLFLNPKYSVRKMKDWKKKSYFPSNFDCYVPETGCLDSRIWDVAHIGDVKSYQLTDPALWKSPQTFLDPKKPKELAQQVAHMKSLCLKKGIKLQVLLSPVYEARVSSWNDDVLQAGFRELAQVTNFWDFSGFTDSSGVSFDSRYFYDSSHFRKAVGEMVLARVYHHGSGCIPPEFGLPITTQNVEALLKTACWQETEVKRASLARHSVQVPILMFHDLGQNAKNGVTESLARFQDQIQALSQAGYHTLFFSDLEHYVDQGQSLPEKPLLITFDDGYISNYRIAWKVLKQYGMKATIFSIGSRVGTTTHNQFGRSLSSYFNYDQAKQMWKSGVCDIQSHSYNMHQEQYFNGRGCRKGVLPLPGEEEAHYVQTFKNDIEQSKRQLEQNVGTQVTAFAYPYGFFTPFSEALLKEEGIRATVTVKSGINSIVKGLPESLQSLCRINVSGTISGKDLVAYLERCSALYGLR